MKSPSKKSALEAAATQLRALSLSTNVGAFIGSEDELIEQFDVARVTLRQAARLLEREGVVRVRRGANGGYFSARPDTRTVEGVLGSYLDTQPLDIEEALLVAFCLWEETVRQAARVRATDVQAITQHLRIRLNAVADDATMADVIAFESEYRQRLFYLAKLPYLELIFQLNRNVTWRYISQTPWGDGNAVSDPEFLRGWREAKLLELRAIEAGDFELARQAAKLDRETWQKRLFSAGVMRRV